MRIGNENVCRDGKSASTGAELLNLKIGISLIDDPIHRRYLKLMKKLSFQKQKNYKVNGVKCKCLPIYDIYATSRCGKIINLNRQKPMIGSLGNTGYLNCRVRRSNDVQLKAYQIHRFVWECHNCIIPKGYVVDHINDNKVGSKLENLQLLTSQQNAQKYHNEHCHKRSGKRPVRAIKLVTKKISFYEGISAAVKHLLIQSKVIYLLYL